MKLLKKMQNKWEIRKTILFSIKINPMVNVKPEYENIGRKQITYSILKWR